MKIRYVHKISPRDTDVREASLNILDLDTHNLTALGAALRKAHVLESGTRVRSARHENGKIVVFTDRGIWHSIVITP